MCSSAFFGLSFRLSQGKWAISFDMSCPKKCCYSVGTEAQIWATTFMPQQRTETKVWDRLLNCEKAESWVQVCYWGWEFFWVRCYLWRWKHLPGSTPRLKPSPTPVDSQRGLCTAALQDPGTGSGGLEQDARSYRSSPTGPALHPWSLSETSTSAFAATGFGIRSQRWLRAEAPPAPWALARTPLSPTRPAGPLCL